jgi:hypothetical protein
MGAIGAIGCAKPTVAVRLVFPSEETFLLSSVATIDIYDGSGTGDKSPDAICRALSVESSQAPAGVSSLASTSKRDVCELRGGAVTLEDVDVGRRVVFAQAESGATVLLRGCVVADIFGDDESLEGDDKDAATALGATALVDVPLATLPTYPSDTEPLCADVNEKCEERKPCAE